MTSTQTNTEVCIPVRLIYGLKRKARNFTSVTKLSTICTAVEKSFPALKLTQYDWHLEFDHGTWIEDDEDWKIAIEYYLHKISKKDTIMTEPMRLQLFIVLGNNISDEALAIQQYSQCLTSVVEENEKKRNEEKQKQSIIENLENVSDKEMNDEKDIVLNDTCIAVDDENDIKMDANINGNDKNIENISADIDIDLSTDDIVNDCTLHEYQLIDHPHIREHFASLNARNVKYPKIPTLNETESMMMAVSTPLPMNRRRNNNKHTENIDVLWTHIQRVLSFIPAACVGENVLWIRFQVSQLTNNRPRVKVLNHILYRELGRGRLIQIQKYPNCKPLWNLKKH